MTTQYKTTIAHAIFTGSLMSPYLVGSACVKASPETMMPITTADSGQEVASTNSSENSIPVITPPELVLVPDRVSNHYASKSTDLACSVTVDRVPDGWKLAFVAAGRERGSDQAWAGYCWDMSLVDLRHHGSLHVVFPEIVESAELQFKLEGSDPGDQDRVLRFPASEVVIPLSNFPRVRDKVGRFCLMLAGKLGSSDSSRASFTVSQVTVR